MGEIPGSPSGLYSRSADLGPPSPATAEESVQKLGLPRTVCFRSREGSGVNNCILPSYGFGYTEVLQGGLRPSCRIIVLGRTNPKGKAAFARDGQMKI